MRWGVYVALRIGKLGHVIHFRRDFCTPKKQTNKQTSFLQVFRIGLFLENIFLIKKSRLRFAPGKKHFELDLLTRCFGWSETNVSYYFFILLFFFTRNHYTVTRLFLLKKVKPFSVFPNLLQDSQNTVKFKK